MFILPAEYVDLNYWQEVPSRPPRITTCPQIGNHWPEEMVLMKTPAEGSARLQGLGWSGVLERVPWVSVIRVGPRDPPGQSYASLGGLPVWVSVFI